MVATQQEYLVWVLDLVRHEEAHGFDTLLAAVHEVANEQELVDRWRPASYLKQPEHIIELTMEVAGDLDGRLKLQQRRLLLNNLLAFSDEPFNSLFV